MNTLQTCNHRSVQKVCVCVFVIVTLFLSAVLDFSSLAIKRYQLWLSLISMSAWQSPIHICQMQWAESNRSPIIHREPCKALATVGLNRAHTESHRDTCTHGQIDKSALGHTRAHGNTITIAETHVKTHSSPRSHTPSISPPV